MNHIVALSGGKDSTAMALRLVETEPEDYTFVCTPTGNEPPAMVGHWQRLEALLGKPLVRLEDPRGLVGIGIQIGAELAATLVHPDPEA